MWTFLTQLTQMRNWNRPALSPVRAADEPAQALLESAEARAGLDPYQAHELRLAARAYLSVVR